MLHGFDVSSYQSLERIRAILRGGAPAFGIVKATEGTGYVNPIHAAQLHEIANAGRPVGLYHFLRHDSSAARQWAHFEELAAPWRGRAIVAVDHEADEDGILPADKIAKAFIAIGHSRGWSVGRYGSAGVAMRYGLGETWRWVASYGRRPRGPWALWQFAPTPVDWSWFDGNEAALHAFWKRHAYHRPQPRSRRVRARGGAIVRRA